MKNRVTPFLDQKVVALFLHIRYIIKIKIKKRKEDICYEENLQIF